MNSQKIKNISAALYNYSAADFDLSLLDTISIEDLILIINQSNNYRAEFRAAWALEHILLKNHEELINYKNEILKIYLNSTNWSAQRSITKILITLIKTPSKYLLYIEEEIKGFILDKSFKLLSSKDCPIAVRCNLYDIIFLIGMEETWILKELKSQIHFDLEKASTPALLSRGNKVLKRILKT